MNSNNLPDARKDAPSFHRNIQPITEVLRKILPSTPADILEVGSGSGQHAAALAGEFSNLTIWPSEYDADSLASIDAWKRHFDRNNIRPARQLDATSDDWRNTGTEVLPEKFAAIHCFNVIHISPWEVTEGLLRGAGKLLTNNGHLIMYGPYRVNGEQTAPSNVEFEKWLKSIDSRNGVRDIGEIEAVANQNGLILKDFHPMPANNFMPIFVRS